MSRFAANHPERAKTAGVSTINPRYPCPRSHAAHRARHHPGRHDHLIGTSSNLLIAGIAGDHGVQMGMLSFAPVALPVAVIGAVVILLTARTLRGKTPTAPASMNWRVELTVGDNALIRGRAASRVGLDSARGYRLVSITRR